MVSAKIRYQSTTTYIDQTHHYAQTHISWQCATCGLWIHAPQIKGLVARCRNCGARSTITRRGTRGYRDYRGFSWGTREYWGVAFGGGKAPVDETDIFVALRQRHPGPEWVYLPQVRTQTGYTDEVSDFDSVRYLDAFAMNCFDSKGYTRVAYEIKVSRSDWLRELEDPRKRAQGYFLCNEFWFAVAPGVYRPDDAGGVVIRKWELTNPLDGCGVIEVQEDGTLTILRKARRHAAWPMPMGFVASLLRHYVTAQQARWMEELSAVTPAGYPPGISTHEAEVIALPLWAALDAAMVAESEAEDVTEKKPEDVAEEVHAHAND